MKRKTTMIFAVTLCMTVLLCACGRKQPTAILFSQKTVMIEIEEQFKQTYTLVPEDADNSELTWQSANEEIATVDAQGNIVGIAPGTTTIVCASKDGVMDTCEITVKSPSAVEQLNEYEKWLFDVMIEKLLPSFYNAPEARIRKIESWYNETEDYSEKMYLLVNIQGMNRFGGTLYKDYVIMCHTNLEESSYIPMFTDSGLWEGDHSELVESKKLDYTKINAALEEYWSGNIHK